MTPSPEERPPEEEGACAKCGREFPNVVTRNRIVCEDCDPFMPATPPEEREEGERVETWTMFVCSECGRYWAKSEGKQQFYCHGVGHERHRAQSAPPIEVTRLSLLQAERERREEAERERDEWREEAQLQQEGRLEKARSALAHSPSPDANPRPPEER